MSWEIGFVLIVAGVAVALFILERFPIDQVALAIPVVLLLGGVITLEEATAGFSHPGTVTVAAMLVLSLGLVKTGAVATLTRWARSAPLGSGWIRLACLCLLVAALSPFMNNTAVVALFLPVFLAVAHAENQPASRFLMPLSFAAILGGTVSLMGTSTNLIVHGMARRRGLDELSLFSIAPLGLIYLLVGGAYMIVAGRWLLPDRAVASDLASKYRVRTFVTELEVTAESPASGTTIEQLGWNEKYSVEVLGVARRGSAFWGAVRGPLHPGDVLYVRGDTDPLLRLANTEQLATPAQRGSTEDDERSDEGRMVEVLVGPESRLAGRTLREARFLQRHGATVVAVQRQGHTVWRRLGQLRLAVGDLLLVHGGDDDLAALADERGLLPLGQVTTDTDGWRPRSFVAAAILAGVVLAAGAGMLPIAVAALAGVVVLLFTGCVRVGEIYAELDWKVLFLLGGLLPLGTALDSTGSAELLGRWLAEAIEPLGPALTIAAFYLVTSLLTELMSNNAAAVVLTPIALQTATWLDVNPYSLLVAVMFGASASFMTPMGYHTNAMIYGPGGYRFIDFLRFGGPLNALLALVAALLIPWFWPV